MKFNFEEGEVILIDKPYKWTSFDVVKKIRNSVRIKKVGHAGTLDPLATGLLVVCTGKMTKIIDTIQDQEKEYTGEIILGATSPSFDLETEVTPFVGISNKEITIDILLNATKEFIGVIQQVPPIYSAIRVGGVRLYKKARRGETVDIPPREVTVKEFFIEAFNYPSVKFKVICSKGTYIRSLAHDLGQALGTGAYLSELCRTRIGNLKLENSNKLPDFIEQVKLYQNNL